MSIMSSTPAISAAMAAAAAAKLLQADASADRTRQMGEMAPAPAGAAAIAAAIAVSAPAMAVSTAATIPMMNGAAGAIATAARAPAVAAAMPSDATIPAAGIATAVAGAMAAVAAATASAQAAASPAPMLPVAPTVPVAPTMPAAPTVPAAPMMSSVPAASAVAAAPVAPAATAPAASKIAPASRPMSTVTALNGTQSVPAVASVAPNAPRASGFGRFAIAGAVLIAAALVLLGGKGGLISNFTFLQLSLMLVYAIAVLGLNLLTGFNGQISLGHGAFFAIGAYVAAVLMERYNANYLLTLPAAAIACFVAGYLFGLPALRLEGHYLALATFALATAVPQILKYRHLEPITGGVQGINLTKPDAPFGLPLSADQWMYLIVLATTVLMFWLARNLLASRPGRAIVAIRDHTMAADTMGINTARYKAITFGISALYVGVAGALHAIIFEFVSPDSFRFDLSVAILVGAVIGGIASLPGALIGGVFVQVIEKYADSATKQLTQAIHLPIELEPWTIYGIMLILLMYVMPGGIAGGLAALVRRVRGR